MFSAGHQVFLASMILDYGKFGSVELPSLLAYPGNQKIVDVLRYENSLERDWQDIHVRGIGEHMNSPQPDLRNMAKALISLHLERWGDLPTLCRGDIFLTPRSCLEKFIRKRERSRRSMCALTQIELMILQLKRVRSEIGFMEKELSEFWDDA